MRVLTTICFMSCCLVTPVPGQPETKKDSLVQEFARAKDQESRCAVLVAAGKLDKPGAAVLKLLVEQVASSDQALGLTAATSLQQLGMKAFSVRPALLEHLRSKRPGVRRAAALALRSIHAEWAKTGPGLIARLRSRDHNERRRALDDISRNKEQARTHVSGIIALLDQRDLRRTGRTALERLGDMVVPHLPEVVALMDRSRDPDTKKECLLLLQQHPKSCAPFVQSVRRAAGDRDRRVRIQAVATLASIGGEHETAARDLLQLADVVDQDLRRTVHMELRHLGKHLVIAIPQIKAMLQDPRGVSTGAWLVLHLPPKQAAPMVPLLAKELSKGNPNTAWYMTFVLGRLGSHAREAVPTLVETLAKGKGRKLLLGAIDALVQIGVRDTPVEKALLEGSHLEDLAVRRVAVAQAFALGLTSADFKERLVALLDDGDQATREVAAQGLFYLGGDARKTLLAHRTGGPYAQALVDGRIKASFFSRSLHHPNALVRLIALASVPRHVPVARRCARDIARLSGDQDSRVGALHGRLKAELERKGILTNPMDDRAIQARLRELEKRGLDALPDILVAIRSGKPKLQVGAIQLVRRLPPDRAAAAVEVLLACLDDPADPVQEAAGTALGHFRKQLTPRLEKDWITGNRRQRVRAALLLPARRRQLPLSVLVAGVEDPSTCFRRQSHVLVWSGWQPRRTPKATLLWSLRRALVDKSRSIRLQALYKISSLGDQVAELAPALQRMFADYEPDLELPMMNAIGSIGPAGMPMLIRAARSEDRGLYAYALDHIHRNGKAARPLLEDMLRGTKHESLYLAGRAAQALGAMQYAEDDAEYVRVKKAMLELLDRIPARTRGSCWDYLFAGLASMGTKARFAVPPLLERAREQRGDSRVQTIETLQRIGATSQQLEELILAVMDRTDTQAVHMRRRIHDLLGSMGADASFALSRVVKHAKTLKSAEWYHACRCLAALWPKLSESDQDVVLQGVQDMIRTDHPAVESRGLIEPLVAAAPSRVVPGLLLALQPVLKTRPSSRTPAGYVLSLLAERHPRVVWSQRARFRTAGQIAIFQGLAKLGDRAEPFLPDLLGLVGGKERVLHYSAVSCLASIGSPAVPALLARLQTDNGKVDPGTLSILRRMGPKADQAAAPVAALLRQKRDHTERKIILATLSHLGAKGLNFLEVLSLPKEETIKLLHQARGIQDDEGRIAIARILLRLEHMDRRFMEMLPGMLRSSEPKTRAMAITALKHLYPLHEHAVWLTRTLCDMLATVETRFLEQLLELLARPESASHALGYVLEMLLHEQPGVRLATLRTLAAYGDAAKPAITAIRELSRNDPSTGVQKRASQMVSGW